MRTWCGVLVGLFLVVWGGTTAMAITKQEIVDELIAIARYGAQDSGVGDVQEAKTKVVSVRIKRLADDRYRAMADIRLYSKKMGAYHVAVFRNGDGSRNAVRTGYVLASYAHAVAVADYEAALGDIYPKWLMTGGGGSR